MGTPNDTKRYSYFDQLLKKTGTMKVKKNWTNEDFQEMGWHDNCIHSIQLPHKQPGLILDIDYIFKWEMDEDSELFQFWVSPCSLEFLNVLYLKFDLDFENSVGLFIENIEQSDYQDIPNSNLKIFKYSILTNVGYVSFQSTGFVQTVHKDPVLNKSQVLS